jgi:spore germination protein GerM
VSDGKERLVAVERQVSAAAPVRAALEELLTGKLSPGCDRPLPPNVALRGAKVAQGVATVDFSKELTANFRGGSDSEGVAVYAIVNTLTSLPGVRAVQILVEGQRVDSIGGHVDVSGPLGFDGELVVR